MITNDASTQTATASGQRERQQSALAAAEGLLAETADAINPGTPAPELLACLTRYRADLSALAAATRAATPRTPTAVGER